MERLGTIAKEKEDSKKDKKKDKKGKKKDKKSNEADDDNDNTGAKVTDGTGDAFLVDFLSQKRWKADPSTMFKDGEGDEDEGEEEYSGEEDELDEVDRFESSYNFRFEEQGPDSGPNDPNDPNNPKAFRSDAATMVERTTTSLSRVQGHARDVDGSLRRVVSMRLFQDAISLY
jgi:hypothetical protein